ncbi:hypothetical protein D3C71_1505950 [compost metagenome]
MECRERAGRDVAADADAGFLPFGWALAVPVHLVLCDFMVLALFQYRASGFPVVLKKTASFCRCAVAVSG